MRKINLLNNSSVSQNDRHMKKCIKFCLDSKTLVNPREQMIERLPKWPVLQIALTFIIGKPFVGHKALLLKPVRYLLLYFRCFLSGILLSILISNSIISPLWHFKFLFTRLKGCFWKSITRNKLLSWGIWGTIVIFLTILLLVICT